MNKIVHAGRPEEDIDFETFSAPSTAIVSTTDAHAAVGDSDWLAFKQRTLRAARLYLDGRNPLILSATLKGPFDGAWVNPWAPKRALLEPRKRKLLQHGTVQMERRRKGAEERKKRAVLLQADGCGNSLNKPVDLTIDMDLDTSKNRVITLGEPQCSLSISDRVLVQRNVLDSSVAVGIQNNTPAPSPEKTPAGLSDQGNVSSQRATAKECDTQHDQRPCSLPTPSESGDEERVIQERPRLRSQQSPNPVPRSGPWPLAAQTSFTPVNGLSSKRKRGSGPDDRNTAEASHMHVDITTVVSDEKTNAGTTKKTVVEHVLAGRAAELGRKCNDCNTQNSIRWHRSGTLCSKCYQKNYTLTERRGRKIKDDTMYQTTLVAVPDRSTCLAFLSQPAVPPTIAFKISHSPLIRASSVPQLNPYPAKPTHADILKHMFPEGISKAAELEDKEMQELMGPSFTPPWHSLLNKYTDNGTTYAESIKSGVNQDLVVEPPRGNSKIQPRAMTFDTPVISRENWRRNVKAAQDTTERAFMDVPHAATTVSHLIQVTASRQEETIKITPPDVESPLGPGPIDAQLNASQPAGIENSAQQQDATTQSASGACSDQLAEDAVHALNTNPSLSKPQSQQETPRSHCRKLFATHTNTLLSAHDASRLRTLARSFGGSFESTPRHSSPTPINGGVVGGSMADIPYMSTQGAMLVAEEAFQKALQSPDMESNSSAGTWQADVRYKNLPVCSITPFRSLVQFNGDQEDAPASVEAGISTQALFDAFIASQVDALHQSKSQKCANFLLTPLQEHDPHEETSECMAQTLRSSLKRIPKQEEEHLGGVKMDSIVEQAGSFPGDWDL